MTHASHNATAPATTLAVTPAATMPTDDAIKLFFAGGVKAKTAKNLEIELQIFNAEHNAMLWDGDFYGDLPLPDARPAKPFANVIESAFAHVSDDVTREEMSSVKVENGKAVATDGRRLFIAPCNDLPDGLWREIDKGDYFVFGNLTENDITEVISGCINTISTPPQASPVLRTSLAKYFDLSGNSPGMSVPRKIGKKWYHCNVDGDFPSYEQVIPARIALVHHLDNAESLLPRLAAAVAFQKMLTRDDSEKSATLYGDGLEICVNPRFLLDAIRALCGYGPVTIGASASHEPIMLTAGDAMVVLMPKRDVTGVNLNAAPIASECAAPADPAAEEPTPAARAIRKQTPNRAIVDFPGGRRLVVTENKVVAVEAKAPSAPKVAAPVAINAAECSRGKGHDTIKDAIVADLKAAGYNSRQVSVKHKGAYYVTIRDASIPGEQIREIAERHERITRDEGTGEILSGGNSFVFVERADGCFPPFEEIARALAAATKAVKESHSEAIKLSHTYFVTKSHGNLYEVTNSDGPGGRFCYRFDYNDPVCVSGAARAIVLHEQDLQYLDGKTPAAECADCAASVEAPAECAESTASTASIWEKLAVAPNAIVPIENAAPVTPPPLPLRYRIASKARNSKPWRIAAVIGAAVAGIYAVLSN